MSRRRAVGLVAAVALALCAAGEARANSYTVAACAGGNGNGTNHLFFPIGQYTGGCGNGVGLWADMRAYEPFFALSGWQVNAPSGTYISGYGISGRTEWVAGGTWAWQIDNGSSLIDTSCFGGLPCGWLPSQSWYQSWGWYRWNRSGLNTPTLRLVTFCVGGSGCFGGWNHSWWMDNYVTFEDYADPGVAGGRGSLWAAAGAWVSGKSVPVGFDASDGTGIQRMRVDVDPTGTDWIPLDRSFGCDYSYAVPCSNHSLDGSVDTTAYPDGAHTVRLGADDASGRWGYAERPLNVDNHAPVPPEISVDGGGAPQSASKWTVRWSNPAGQFAPIATAYYRVCRADGTGCATSSYGVPSASGGSSQANAIAGDFGITAPGDYAVQLWLADAAGNVDGSQPSNSVHLRYDGGVIGAAQLGAQSKRWLNAQDATTWSEPIQMAAGAIVPASGVAGYAVTTDGSDPGTAVNAPAAADGSARFGPPPGGWPNGTVTVKARAVSGTGQGGPVAQTMLRVDRLAPATVAYGQGSPAVPQPDPVTVTLAATDPAGGSGMGAADDGELVESAGHLAYTLDTAPLRKAGGDTAQVTVTGGGLHTITFRAYDAAGNVSADRSVTVAVQGPFDPDGPAGTGFTARSYNPRATFAAAPSFGTACPSQATLTASRDAYVDQALPGQSFGGATSLVVRSAASANARALLDFDLPGAGSCSVTSATLRIFATGSGAGRALAAFRIGSPWSDATVAWDTRPGVSGPPAVASTADGPGWLSFDVTAQVRDIYARGDNGFSIRDAAEGSSPAAGETFGSSEGDAAQRPRLLVSFG